MKKYYEKNYIVSSGYGPDVIGGMAGDGSGVPFDELPETAQTAISEGNYEYDIEGSATRYIREE